MWRSERDFVQYIKNKLKGISMTRIESGGTGNGIPDMYVVARGYSFWIEFKNMRNDSIKDNEWNITWRPGQQAWLLQNTPMYLTKTTTHYNINYTVVGMKDGIVIIPMTKFYTDNRVMNTIHVKTVSISELKSNKFDILKYLCTRSEVIRPSIDTMQMEIIEATSVLLNEYLVSMHKFYHNHLVRYLVRAILAEILDKVRIDTYYESVLSVSNKKGNDMIYKWYDSIVDKAISMYEEN